MSKRILALILAVVMAFALTACQAPPQQADEGPATDATDSTPVAPAGDADAKAGSELKPIAKEDLKVGFVYIGDINDGGYTQAHDKGRLALEEQGIECIYKENIPENADCEVAVRELVDAGCNVIFTTSFGHMDYTETVAKEYPEIYFNHATGYKTLPNMCNYMGRVIESRYLAGIVAGMKTEANKIGYVAAMQIPECIRGINAFTLGVQSVNPDATVEVIWTNTWYDPAVEKQAAITLLDKGCDVIEQHQDSPAPQVAAEERGKFAIGYNTPTPDAAPKAYLTAPLFHWDKFYVDCVTRITEGTWVPGAYWEGLASGWVGLDELSDLCAPGTAEKVEAAKQGIIDGSLVLFSGEVKAQDGTVKYADGMPNEDIYNMDWFIEGVIGTIG